MKMAAPLHGNFQNIKKKLGSFSLDYSGQAAWVNNEILLGMPKYKNKSFSFWYCLLYTVLISFYWFLIKKCKCFSKWCKLIVIAPQKTEDCTTVINISWHRI